jgi:hypothetical protein
MMLVLLLSGSRIQAADEGPPRPTAILNSPQTFRALTLTYEAMAGLDWYTTSRVIGNGSHEANPLLGPIVDHPALFIATKAATTAVTIYVAKQLWKRNHVVAVTVLIAANIFTATVVAHNASLGGAQRWTASADAQQPWYESPFTASVVGDADRPRMAVVRRRQAPTATTRRSAARTRTGWQWSEIKAIGDVNGDGKADVILRDKVTGQNIGWPMKGLTAVNSAFLPTIADTNWQIVWLG